MGEKKIKLGIIEDRLPVLEALEMYFSRSEKFDLVNLASSMEEFMALYKLEDLDVLLCDIGLPGTSGIDVTWQVKKKASHVHIVIFTVFDDRNYVFQALCAGASGYLLKSTPLPQIEEQLLEVMKGGAVMSPQIARLVFEHFNTGLDNSPQSNYTELLTSREKEIVVLLKQGLSNKQVAEKSYVSVDTIKYHIRNIYTKLQINSRSELILKYK